MATQTASNLQTAIDLARAGFHVFPCHAGGDRAKQPMNPPVMSWPKQSSADASQVQRWWSRYPQAAIGLDLAKSGLLVIDADRHGQDDGVAAMGELMDAHGYHPDGVPLAATPNEGTHFFYRQPDGVDPHGNGRGALPAGIDVRGSGGYVIAPGTIMQDGRLYEVFGDLRDAPVIPEWLWQVIKAPRDKVQTAQNAPIAEPVAHAPISEDRTIGEIADLLDHISPDCPYDDWINALMAVHAETGGSQAGLDIADRWSARGSKYKGRRELDAKWRSFKRNGVAGGTLAAIARSHGANLSAIAIKHGKAEDQLGSADHGAAVMRAMLEARDGTLTDAETGEVIDEGHGLTVGGDWTNPGGLIGDIADWITMTAPMPNHRLSIAAAISFVSLVVSRHRETPGYSGGMQLYTICTGQTAIGKDWPMKAIERLAIETGLQSLIKSGKITTSLAIETAVERNPVHLILADEVGRRIFGKAGHKRASTYESGITDTLLELWSASPVSVFRTTQRVSSDPAVIEGPAVSLFGVSTHKDLYTGMGRASIDNGMINRMLIIEADKRSPLRSIDGSLARKPPAHILDAVEQLMPAAGKNVLGGGIQLYMAQSGVDARPVPWAGDDVKQQWEAFREEMLALSDRNEEVAPFVGRSAEMALRLACIHALSWLGKDGSVGPRSVDWGINVARESVRNAVHGAEEYIVTSDFQEHVKRVERIVRAKGHVPKSIVARKMGGSIDNRTLDAVIGHLTLAGKVIVSKNPKTTKGEGLQWVGS